jgi:PPOX class probable F420-dependent enzyme
MASPETKREKIEAFLAEPRNVMVAALRKDGRPQMTPNWFYWDGSRFYISTTRTRRKYANLRRDPRVQLAVDDPTSFKCVLIDGTAEIWEDHRQGLPYFRAITMKHRGQAPDDDAILSRLAQEQRVLLVITPEKAIDHWTSWGL